MIQQVLAVDLFCLRKIIRGHAIFSCEYVFENDEITDISRALVMLSINRDKNRVFMYLCVFYSKYVRKPTKSRFAKNRKHIKSLVFCLLFNRTEVWLNLRLKKLISS